jgi:hypothetical protein
MSIAMVDPATREPAIKLAIQGMDSEGWYSLGNVTVHQTLAGKSGEESPAPSHP